MKEKISIYSPIRDELLVVVEYIDILDLREDIQRMEEIVLLMEMFEALKKKCDLYLNYQLMKLGLEDYFEE
jgi:hypothetical protein